MGKESKWLYASIMAAVFAAGSGLHPALAADVTGKTTTVDTEVKVDVYGGQGTEAGDNVTKNTVTITETGYVTWGRVYGGYSPYGKADENTVDAENAYVKGTVYGGYVFLDEDNTSITAPFTADASGNTVTLKNTTVFSLIYGGSVERIGEDSDLFPYLQPSAASNNTVTITNESTTPITYQDIYGGYTTKGDASGNTIRLEGTLSGSGAEAQTNVFVKSRFLKQSAYVTGGETWGGSANGNKVSLENIGINDNVIGGYTENDLYVSDDRRAYVSTNGNSIYLKNVYGADDDSGNNHWSEALGGYVLVFADLDPENEGAQLYGESNDNTVTLVGSPDMPQLAHIKTASGSYTESNANFNVNDTSSAERYAVSLSSNGNTVSLNHYQAGNVIAGNSGTAVYVYKEYGSQKNSSSLSIIASDRANDNRVFLTDSTVTRNVIGGGTAAYIEADEAIDLGMTLTQSMSDTATGNTVVLTGSNVTGQIDNEELRYGHVVGGLAFQGTAAGNTVNLSDSTVTSAYGGAAGELGTDGTLRDDLNEIAFLSDTYVGAETQAKLTSKAKDNTVNMISGTADSLWGGYAKAFEITQSDYVNHVEVFTTTNYDSGSANGNTVNYYGGTVNQSIIGGQSESAATNDNIVNLYGTLVGSSVSLSGGIGKTESTGNTLNVYTLNNSVANLDHFQNLNFYVPTEAVNGNTMLTVTGTADVSGASIQAGVEKTTALKGGDEINLLYDAKGITADGATYGTLAGLDTVMDAGFVIRPVEVKQKDANTLVLHVLEGQKATLSPDTKLIAESSAAALNFIGAGADTALDAGFMAASQASQNSESQKNFTPYVTIGGQNMRYDTGSYVDSNGYAGNLGLVRRIANDNSVDTIMPFAEYGKGNYTSHLDNGSRGDGTQHYGGVGLLLRRDLNNGVYYQASLRAGVMDGDFRGALEGYHTTYDTHARYAGASLGLGRIYQQTDKDSVDVYGRFNYTHLTSDDVTLHNALGTADYNLDAADSYRTRLGARWTHNYQKNQSYYAGLGWDYEFDSTARATYDGLSTPSPESKGSSALLELGWKSDATKENPWGADLRVTGWAGKQRGLVFNASLTRRL